MSSRDADVEAHNRREREAALARYRKLRDAFVAVFGPPGQPNPQAAIVLEEIDRYCNRRAFSVALDTNGQTDVPRTFARMGLRDAADRIHRMIEWKESEHVDPSSEGP